MLDRFEAVLILIAGVLIFFTVVAQWDIRREHNEQLLHRQLQYEAFLAGETKPAEWAAWYVVKQIRPIRPISTTAEGKETRP